MGAKNSSPETAPFTLKTYNPDVLNTIANLSNDEVFTPPELARDMLDKLEMAWAANHNGANIWADPNITFLDPFTKSGVFLREITSKLVHGLKGWNPDLEQRVDHILTKQIFGIGVTQLTALLARRSVYCSKAATGKHSIAHSFDREWGNIWFDRTEHVWTGGTERVTTMDQHGKSVVKTLNGRCKYCGASQKEYERGNALESHAYDFIHTDDVKLRMAEIFGENMHFDVVIGNPPYQLNDGGGSGTSAAPIYQLFVEQAKALEPKYLSMVTPARWFAGGKGLDEFRAKMLQDRRLREIYDFPDSNDVFPGTQIKGGIAYWLWDRDNPGPVTVTGHNGRDLSSKATRPLLEPGADVFIRFNEAIPILRKIASTEHNDSEYTFSPPVNAKFADLVSSRRPFGLPSNFKGKPQGELKLYRAGGSARVDRDDIFSGHDYVDRWKIFIPFLGSGSDAFPHSILGTPFVGAPGTVCTETYLSIGPFDSELICKNAISYISTRIFRFLVLQKKPSQNATRKVYEFVPTQDFSESWTDEKLYEKYGLSKPEIAFIESLIRPMEA